MVRNNRYAIIAFIALVLGLSAKAVAAEVDESLIDRQHTAVATNLGLFGGQPLDITVDSTTDTVYAATYTPNGIFVTDTSGTTWTTLPSTVDYGAGKAIVVDVVTGDAYALIGDEVIKTTDQGVTWEELTNNLVGHPIIGAAALYAHNTLLVGTDSGTAQISSDGGETFVTVTIQSGTTSTTIESFAAGAVGTFYAVVVDNANDVSTLYRSTDSGGTWNVVDVESGGVAPDSIFYSIAVDSTDTNHLVLVSYHPDYLSYHSLDGGVTWLALENGLSRIGAQEAVFDGNGRLYIGIYYSDNPTAATPTWTEITMSTPLSSVRGDIYAVDLSTPTTIFTNTGLGIASSTDAGLTWTDLVEGMTALQTFDIAQANDKAVVWIGANGGLAKTTNFTSTTPDWEFPILPEDGISSIQAVWVKPTNGEYILAGLTDYISLSTDGGDTWEHTVSPAFRGTVKDIVQSPTDHQTLYAVYTNTSLTDDAYNGGVLMSTDTGATWSDLDFSHTLASATLAVATRQGNDRVYVGIGAGGTETGVYVYDGSAWEQLEEDFGGLYVNNILVHPEDHSIIFVSLEAASTIGALYRSADHGETFTELTDGLEGTNHLGVMTAQPGETTTIYLAGQAFDGQGMIYKSSDGGDTWNDYYTGLKQEFFYALLFDGLISGNDRGLFNLQSLGRLTVRANFRNREETLRLTLKDAATAEALAERRLKIYKRRSGRGWQLVDNVTTNARGKVTVRLPARRGTRFKAVWRPNITDQAEYTRATSRIVRAR